MVQQGEQVENTKRIRKATRGDELLEAVYQFLLLFFTNKGISKSQWLIEYDLNDIVYLVIQDFKQQRQKELMTLNFNMLPLMAIFGGKEGANEIKKTVKQIQKLAGIENKEEYNHEQTMNSIRAKLGLPLK